MVVRLSCGELVRSCELRVASCEFRCCCCVVLSVAFFVQVRPTVVDNDGRSLSTLVDVQVPYRICRDQQTTVLFLISPSPPCPTERASSLATS